MSQASTHESSQTHASGGHDMSAMLATNERALKISSWLTGIYFIIELGLGYLSGSVAVLSDAFHTFSAVGGVLLALVAGRLAARAADRYRTFGSVRAEIIGALLNGLFLFVMAAFVLYMGVVRLLNPVEIEYGLMLLAAAGGLITEFISLRLLFSGQKGNLNMKGAFWHVMQTFIGSLIIIIAAVVVYFTGYVAIDPILGIAFGLVLFWASWSITREAVNVLMETVPDDVDVALVQDALTSLTGVYEVHHIHAWALTSGKNLFSAHLLINESADHHEVLNSAHHLLRERFGFYFATLQIETKCPNLHDAPEIDFADTRPMPPLEGN